MAQISFEGGKMKNALVDENGNINPNFSLIIGLIGAGLIFSAFYFEMNFYLSVVVMIVGFLLVGFSGLATQSSTLDLRAFTKDPLGWRKAKKRGEHSKLEDEDFKK
jgi:hypothetical protein